MGKQRALIHIIWNVAGFTCQVAIAEASLGVDFGNVAVSNRTGYASVKHRREALAHAVRRVGLGPERNFIIGFVLHLNALTGTAILL